jgi:predicted nucleic acid-binding protein
MILNTVYDGRADFIVTGDKALLRLKRFKKIKILSVSEALIQI